MKTKLIFSFLFLFAVFLVSSVMVSAAVPCGKYHSPSPDDSCYLVDACLSPAEAASYLLPDEMYGCQGDDGFCAWKYGAGYTCVDLTTAPAHGFYVCNDGKDCDGNPAFEQPCSFFYDGDEDGFMGSTPRVPFDVMPNCAAVNGGTDQWEQTADELMDCNDDDPTERVCNWEPCFQDADCHDDSACGYQVEKTLDSDGTFCHPRKEGCIVYVSHTSEARPKGLSGYIQCGDDGTTLRECLPDGTGYAEWDDDLIPCDITVPEKCVSGTEYTNAYCAPYVDCTPSDPCCNAAGDDYLTGPQGCGTCKYCDGTKSTCSDIASGTADNSCTGSAVCTSCKARNIFTGDCDGSGSCEIISQNVASGDVCKDGDSVSPSGNSNCCAGGSSNCYCDLRYKCDSVNDCTYDSYYTGFSNSNFCSPIGPTYANTHNFPTGYRCSDTSLDRTLSDIYDSDPCASNYDHQSHCASGVCKPDCAMPGEVGACSVNRDCCYYDDTDFYCLGGTCTATSTHICADWWPTSSLTTPAWINLGSTTPGMFNILDEPCCMIPRGTLYPFYWSDYSSTSSDFVTYPTSPVG